MKHTSFSPKNRISHKSEFNKIYTTGKKFVGKYLIINYILLPEDELSRLGLTVSKKIGKANKRNYVKRVVREIFRKIKNKFINNYAIVVTAKNTIKNKKYHNIEEDILYIFNKTGIL